MFCFSPRSKCRFLHYANGRLYIVDLGLDCVYVLDPKKNTIKLFGASGRLPGQFNDPAGLAVDEKSNLIIADSRNHRVQIFDRKRKCLGLVKVRGAGAISFFSSFWSEFIRQNKFK